MKGDILLTGYPSLDHIAITKQAKSLGGTWIIERHWADSSFGGCAANVAVALARLGIRTRVSFALGNDQESQAYLNHLHQERVDATLVERKRGSMPRSYFFLSSSKEGRLYFDPAVCRDWQGPKIISLTGVDWVVLSVGPFQATKRFLRTAVEREVPLVWLFKQDYQAFPKNYLSKLLAASDLLFANTEEIEELCSILGIAHKRDLLTRGPTKVVLTQGDQGATIFAADGITEIDAIPTRVVDPTGAGDAFAAGFLFGYYHGLSTLQCGRLGAVLASFTIEQWGCQASLPGLSQAAQRYRDTYSDNLNFLTERNLI